MLLNEHDDDDDDAWKRPAVRFELEPESYESDTRPLDHRRRCAAAHLSYGVDEAETSAYV